MTVIDGFPAQSGVVDPVELRKVLAGLIIRTTAGVARQGIFPRTTTSIVTSLASMNVAVSAFEGCAVRGGGPVLLANDGTVNVAIAAAPVSNSRIDVVYFRQKENGYGGFADGSSGPEIAVVTGVAAASPVKPALPTGAVELATVLVPAGVATTNAGGVVITQTYQYTALTGGKIWVRNSTELAALTGFADDVRAQQLDVGIEYLSDGGVWKAWESDWITYVATLAGFVVGTGGSALNYTAYRWRAGVPRIKFEFIFGTSAGSVTASPTFTLPPGMTLDAPPYSNMIIHPFAMLDSGTASIDAGRARYNGTDVDKIGLVYQNAILTTASIGTNAPWTWVAGDAMAGEFDLPVAA